MSKLPVVLLGLLVTSSVFAQSCPIPRLYDFTVYSVGNIDVQQSDYQGLAGAGGSILATNFQFNATVPGCLAVSSGRDLGIQSAAINGGAEASGMAGINNTSARGDIVGSGAYISNSSVYGRLITTQAPTIHSSGVTGSRQAAHVLPLQANHSAVAQELYSESARMASYKPDNTAKLQNGDLVISLRPGNNIISISKPDDLIKAQRIVITGSASSTAMINVAGDSFVLEHQDVSISGNIYQSNITWNFYQASFLHIAHTENSHVGMPGRVMAPRALVEFNEALITGALYADEIVTSMTPSGLNAGQVNRDTPIENVPAPQQPPAPVVPRPK